jgi:hypothetical protein
VSSSYLVHFIEYSNSSSPLSVSVSISPNKTLSPQAIREYVPRVSAQRLYLLNSGLL